MLTMCALLMTATGQPTKGFDYLPKNTTSCQYTGVSLILKPHWQINSQSNPNEKQAVVSSETNLEAWKSQVHAPHVYEMAPTIAIQYTRPNRFGSSGFVEPISIHHPWHLAIQRHWPDYFGTETALSYHLLKMPTTHQPYYEAVVSAVPSIRCRGKTLEQVQKQLLQQYASYLENMMEEGVSDYERRDEVVFGEAWNATLPVKSELTSNDEVKRRSSRNPNWSLEGKEAQHAPTGHWDLVFPVGYYQ
ncbi:MAG TPA: hypothetical protein PLN21_12100 [Gemmatales bacterium]|nr:hypothetical protein [Gemmatales bacterium]